ncbi:bifunctional [glutamine synthetase] adenylyltransferase/[glutamine synthetase]-adenylyl-L-tyrosine phosphorylase [Brevibacterium sp. 50QC2O2]|uniref:bifunctional [glutamine synthetase] adenylyltransferase/[glutamine synthetase]-adenylyl-L-tyrosine phosphorylase n=1 Tax=Brevibacterium TaxID=1696 RepID=UPI00211D0237|nr:MULTISPECIES: bifunctional [glutamine synthetase] adenylyltransferase/[glutamine synthetase]-adenylyl-L-tyrosine phosphorylase [unclassified Brevibacterium]MCQ9366670.1 bifunctional [glutamine synthetase] adenylyltransferase/[glutamine synthetase]-adenylyl-L-tyrosine phosphorylase [Brevibacterium sp. 91QC2O2]MCQ9384353.1 bifunctional [glutamine synthetase] adenylyltransferase/[glutamine synthetase]-adenylyl-L-tyrosine phosphorylase [Brevibacterium sp. 68QC2CO]MCQ9389590.1 bifunctional [glutam
MPQTRRSQPTGRPGKSGRPQASFRYPRFLTEAAQLLDRPALSAAAATALARSVADPDAAGLAVIRVAEAVATHPDASGLADLLATSQVLRRVIALGGYSEACIDFIIRHPQSLRMLALPEPGSTTCLLGTSAAAQPALRAHLFDAVGADPEAPAPVAMVRGEEGRTALRVAYRELLIRLTADDLLAQCPTDVVAEVCRILADMAASAIDAALAVARAELDPDARVRLAVIGMGKCGARELNYVSDVDVVYCAEPAAERELATALANRVAELIDRPAAEPALWELDAALRPEGKAGPLVRPLEEFRSYYERTAENWEFQALLKARPIAGDVALGHEWFEAFNPLVWTAAARPGFIDGVRAMRRRVVDLIPANEAARQLKLGSGGLRDVEFSAQLLQLVHGREEQEIRVTATLDVIPRLAGLGYIGADDGRDLAAAYRFMRVVEHRLQIPRMQRTALLPDDPGRLRTLARAVYADGDRSAERLAAERTVHSRRVRVLHQQIFYRPILQAAAGADSIVRMSDSAARDRLAAFGYKDPKSALLHIGRLAQGTGRSAHVQKQVLPALLDWFADGVDPDAALLSFRRLSESLSGSTWYLKMLRDSGVAARAMARVLSLSAYATELLLKNPSAVAWLEEPLTLAVRSDLRAETAGLLRRHGAESIPAIRGLYGRELLRCALADVLEVGDRTEIPARLAQIVDATIAAGCQAMRLAMDTPETPAYEFAVIAMGRLGGAEVGYSSDADVMFVYRPAGDLDDDARSRLATHVKKLALRLIHELGQAGAAPAVELDADLRPEGKNGPLVRTLESYRAYYGKWSEPWEAQALLRARPIAGDQSLAADYLELIEPLRYPAVVPESSLRQMRRLKARMEAERLPRGADIRRHLKLGHGGLSDVEWTVQLLQLVHGHGEAALHTTSTLPALHAEVALGVIGGEDAQVLEEAWLAATQIRCAAVLFRGRIADSLPARPEDLEAVARLMGYGPGLWQEFQDDYLRAARHARKVVERLFFGYEE